MFYSPSRVSHDFELSCSDVEHSAKNMKLLEATEYGLLLLTDQKNNLQEHFDMGPEIMACTSLESCPGLINVLGASQG